MNRYQQRMSNPLDYSSSLRSLLPALNAWITDEKPPPSSTYPRIDNGTDSAQTSSLASGAGSFILFARTRAERLKNHDRRRSLEERYRSRSQYLIYITKAANRLADEGYLLRIDVPAIVEQAGTRWDFVSKQMTR